MFSSLKQNKSFKLEGWGDSADDDEVNGLKANVKSNLTTDKHGPVQSALNAGKPAPAKTAPPGAEGLKSAMMAARSILPKIAWRRPADMLRVLADESDQQRPLQGCKPLRLRPGKFEHTESYYEEVDRQKRTVACSYRNTVPPPNPAGCDLAQLEMPTEKEDRKVNIPWEATEVFEEPADAHGQHSSAWPAGGGGAYTLPSQSYQGHVAYSGGVLPMHNQYAGGYQDPPGRRKEPVDEHHLLSLVNGTMQSYGRPQSSGYVQAPVVHSQAGTFQQTHRDQDWDHARQHDDRDRSWGVGDQRWGGPPPVQRGGRGHRQW